MKVGDDHHRELRARRFSYAVLSSLLSKIATAGVQIIALPIAAAALGTHGFALYSVLAAAVGWLALTNLSIAPSLVVRLARLTGPLDRAVATEVLSSGFFLNLLAAGVTGGVALAIVVTAPVHEWFGPAYAHDKTAVTNGLTALVFIFTLQTSLAPLEAAQAAYQQQHILNLVSAVSGLFCVLAVATVARQYASPVALIVAVNGPNLLFRTANAVSFLARNRHLIPTILGVRKSLCTELAGGGVTYALAATAGNFLSHVLPILIVARIFEPAVAAAFAATMNAVVLVSGVLTMIMMPLWPAIADSTAKGDTAWARHAYHRLVATTMLFGILVAAAFAAVGVPIFQLWFGGHLHPTSASLSAAGIYFLASAWEVAHFTMLVGLDRVKVASVLIFARALLGTAGMIVIAPHWEAAGPFLVMTLAFVLVDMVPLRRLTLAALRAPQMIRE